jgi:hypothetical protein
MLPTSVAGGPTVRTLPLPSNEGTVPHYELAAGPLRRSMVLALKC